MHKKQSASHILVRNTSWVFMAKLVSQGLGFVALVLVVRKIDVEVFGQFSLFLSLFSLFGIFAMSPSILVLRRYVPQIHMYGTWQELSKVVLGSLYSAFFLFLLTALLIFLLQTPLGGLLHIEDFSSILPLFIVYVSIQASYQFTTTMMGSLLLHKASSLLMIFGAIVRTGCYFALIDTLDVRRLLLIEAVVAGLFVFPASVFLVRWGWLYRKTEQDRTPLGLKPGSMVRYGAYGMFNEIGGGVIGSTSDYYIVSALGNSFSLGLYAFSNRLLGYFLKLLPVNEFLSVLRPIFISRFSHGDTKDFKQIYNFIVKVMLPVYAFPGLIIFSLGRPIIEYVFDPKYLNAYWVAVPILFMTLPMAFAMPLGLVAELKERMDICFKGKLVAFLSIPLGILAMKYVGLVGVAVVTLVCDILKNILIYFLLRRVVDVRFEWKSFSGYGVSWLFLSLGFYYLQPYTSSLLLTAVGVILFSILFGLSVVLLNPYSQDDFVLLEKLIDHVRGLKRYKLIIMKLFCLKLKGTNAREGC